MLDTCYNHWNRYFPYRNRYFPCKRWWLTWKGLRFWGKAGWISLNSSYFTRTWSLGFQGPAIFSEMITISFITNSFTRHAPMSPFCSTNVTLLSREYRATGSAMSSEMITYFFKFHSQSHESDKRWNVLLSWSQGCRQVVARLSPGCRQVVARLSPGWHFCTLATLKLSLCCTRLTKSKFSCTNRILRHAEFQICITLPHRRASEVCRTQNSFIPTFSGHWSPAWLLKPGGEPIYIITSARPKWNIR